MCIYSCIGSDMVPDDPQGRTPDRDGDAASKPKAVRISAATLFQGGTELIVEHNGDDYRLRITSRGKLILTK